MPKLGDFDWRKSVAFVLGIAVLAQLLTVVAMRITPAADAPDAATVLADTEVADIGVTILTDHAFSLEIIGVLLLAATIGAVVLAKKRFV